MTHKEVMAGLAVAIVSVATAGTLVHADEVSTVTTQPNTVSEETAKEVTQADVETAKVVVEKATQETQAQANVVAEAEKEVTSATEEVANAETKLAEAQTLAEQATPEGIEQAQTTVSSAEKEVAEAEQTLSDVKEAETAQSEVVATKEVTSQASQQKVAEKTVEVEQSPANVKAVVNADGENTNGTLVPKGSTQTWTLTNSPLKAGRQVVTSYVMNDPLPSGFVLDREATATKNTAWVMVYDESGKIGLQATEATLAMLNANRDQDVAVPVAYLVGTPINDGGTYKNTFDTVIKTPSGEYKVVSNTPVIYTPGNDPKTPRETPDGDNPTPNDNLIQPEKDVIDATGKSIDGESVLPNTVLNYVAKQDFDQYKGMSASQSSIAKGFVYADDYLDAAIDGKSLVVNSITAANGDDVTKLLTRYHVLSQDSLSAALQELVKTSGISPVGEFYLWVAKDPQAFYEAYVQKGLDITYNLSFKIKESFTEGDITNQTFQVDFGNGYYGNVVVNNLPKLEVHKDVLDKEGKSLDQGKVKIGEEVTYKLEGWVVPTGRSYDLFEYKFVDQLQQTHDLYLKDSVIAKVDITLADGSVIKKGTDLAEYTETIYNKETGLYELAFKEDFLKQVSRDSEFGADDFLVVKRIKAGDVYNTTDLYVNSYKVKSETVVT
ncbi:hypothetical protein SAG0014_12615, partial [Streptococcus agalactiae FSL S3-586]|uniref:adhesin isopeptide-forming adherence domain-containing protein n=1 Tax=Streptococcus agalactiae TaxID=1311 RepID=UPI00037EC30C